jgi:hypothetical protein
MKRRRRKSNTDLTESETKNKTTKQTTEEQKQKAAAEKTYCNQLGAIPTRRSREPITVDIASKRKRL